jgi:hypothetical protein
VISLSFARGLSEGMQLRRLLTEMVRVAERERLFHHGHPIDIAVMPFITVHGSFGFWTEWQDGSKSIQIAGRDYRKPRNRKEAEESKRILADYPKDKQVPWQRHVCWTLGHEIAHVCGVMDEDEADAWGLRLLEAARVRSAVLRQGTRRT